MVLLAIEKLGLCFFVKRRHEEFLNKALRVAKFNIMDVSKGMTVVIV